MSMSSTENLQGGKVGPRLLPWMTLKSHYALCFKTYASFGAHHEDLNEDRPTLWRRKCRRMILVSGNIRFIRIFAGLPSRGDVNHQRTDGQLTIAIPHFALHASRGNKANIIIILL